MQSRDSKAVQYAAGDIILKEIWNKADVHNSKQDITAHCRPKKSFAMKYIHTAVIPAAIERKNLAPNSETSKSLSPRAVIQYIPGAYSKCFMPFNIGVDTLFVSTIYLDIEAKKASDGSNKPILPM